MANYHFSVTGKYYFPGLYTAVLPMVPGISAVCWLFKNRNRSADGAPLTPTLSRGERG
jgi:hypothetical protein